MSRTNPPRFAEMLLHAILDRDDRDYIIGDLREEYRVLRASEPSAAM